MAYKKNQPVTENVESREERAVRTFSEMMLKKMEELKTDWKKPWFTEGICNIMPQNIDGRLYNGMNTFMLLMHTEEEEYKSPIYVTFDRLQNFNYKDVITGKGKNKKVERVKNDAPVVSIKKGEHSFPVFLTLYYVVNINDKSKITLDQLHSMSKEQQDEYRVYTKQSVYNVFNIDQTNLEESRPELYAELIAKNARIVQQKKRGKKAKFHFAKADDMLKNQDWVCPIELKKQDSACYVPSKDKIILPMFDQFITGEAFYSTMFHEMTHSTGTEERLNRDMKGRMGTKAYGREELVAEMTAALVCHTYGFDNGIKEESAAYIKGWCNAIKEDVTFIKDVLTDVRKAYSLITKHINELQ